MLSYSSHTPDSRSAHYLLDILILSNFFKLCVDVSMRWMPCGRHLHDMASIHVLTCGVDVTYANLLVVLLTWTSSDVALVYLDTWR
jgi:hypothetical protein